MASIKMTPQELRDSASFLGNKRGEIVDAVSAIKSRVDSTAAEWEGAAPVSYTHLDVYKRQQPWCAFNPGNTKTIRAGKRTNME